MIIKVIKTDNNQDSYFNNKVTGKVQSKYEKDPNLILVTKIDNSIVEIPNYMIEKPYGGQLIVDYSDDEKYIIDDGYQDLLIRAGYIILNNYDVENIENKESGYQTRIQFMETVKDTVKKLLTENNIQYKITCMNQYIKFVFEISGYQFTISVDSVNSIVNKNMQRKVNNLPFYPFIKTMDKFGTLYLSIFCKRINDNIPDDFNRYNQAEKIIIQLLEELNNQDNNDYHFERIIIKKRINNFEGI